MAFARSTGYARTGLAPAGKRPRAAEQPPDHRESHHERRGRLLEDRRDISLEDEVTEKHDRIGRREEDQMTTTGGTGAGSPRSPPGPAHADVEEMVDRVLVVLAIA